MVTFEALVRLKKFVERDLDQRFLTMMNSLVVHDSRRLWHFEEAAVKGTMKGQVHEGYLPRYKNDRGEDMFMHDYHFAPFNHYFPEADLTLWVNLPLAEVERPWPAFLRTNQQLLTSPEMFRSLWKRFGGTDHNPFPMNRKGQFEAIYDKKREVEWLNNNGFIIDMMLFRDPSEVMSVERKFEQAFIRKLDVLGEQFTPRTVEDFKVLLARLSELENEVASGRNSVASLAIDDSELVDRLRGIAFRIKSEHGKEAGDLAFNMQDQVRKFLLKDSGA